MKQIYKEPLIHFLALGALIFAAFYVLQDDASVVESESITVDSQSLERFVARFEDMRQRPPTMAELDAFAQSLVDEEVLVRQAHTLSLDVGDAVIRQRLAQKMNFLAASAAASIQPTEAQLKAFFAENPDRYAKDGRIAFEQVMLGEAPTEAEIAEALTKLQAGIDPLMVGWSTILPAGIGLSTSPTIDSMFGSGFFEAVDAVEDSGWTGPVKSGFGMHLVRITDRTDKVIPEFEEVRAYVAEDWGQEIEEDFKAKQLEALRAAYQVNLPSDAEKQAVLQ